MEDIVRTIWLYVRTFTFVDALDILLAAFLLYNVMKLLRGTSAEMVLKGIALLLLVRQLAEWLGFSAINYTLKNTMQLGLLAVLIVFQPELRKMLERVGKSRVPLLFNKEDNTRFSELTIIQVVEACTEFSSKHTGALIVFERHIRLPEIISTGTVVDASVNVGLIKNIFYPKAPMHDGAMIVSGNRVVAAACVLPLTTQLLSRDLGTRHRAAVGVSEVSDAVAVVVSEETGTMSIAVGGALKRHLSPSALEKMLRFELIAREETQEQNAKKSRKNRKK